MKKKVGSFLFFLFCVIIFILIRSLPHIRNSEEANRFEKERLHSEKPLVIK